VKVSGQLAVGSWQLAVGSWQLVVGGWWLVVGISRLELQKSPTILKSICVDLR